MLMVEKDAYEGQISKSVLALLNEALDHLNDNESSLARDNIIDAIADLENIA